MKDPGAAYTSPVPLAHISKRASESAAAVTYPGEYPALSLREAFQSLSDDHMLGLWAPTLYHPPDPLERRG